MGPAGAGAGGWPGAEGAGTGTSGTLSTGPPVGTGPQVDEGDGDAVFGVDAGAGTGTSGALSADAAVGRNGLGESGGSARGAFSGISSAWTAPSGTDEAPPADGPGAGGGGGGGGAASGGGIRVVRGPSPPPDGVGGGVGVRGTFGLSGSGTNTG